jgi:hypothetical protein
MGWGKGPLKKRPKPSQNNSPVAPAENDSVNSGRGGQLFLRVPVPDIVIKPSILNTLNRAQANSRGKLEKHVSAGTALLLVWPHIGYTPEL